MIFSPKRIESSMEHIWNTGKPSNPEAKSRVILCCPTGVVMETVNVTSCVGETVDTLIKLPLKLTMRYDKYYLTYHVLHCIYMFGLWCLTPFSTILQSVLLVEETGAPGKPPTFCKSRPNFIILYHYLATWRQWRHKSVRL